MNQRLSVAVPLVAIAVLAASLPASAAVEEIVVTAQRREQNLQDFLRINEKALEAVGPENAKKYIVPI